MMFIFKQTSTFKLDLMWFEEFDVLFLERLLPAIVGKYGRDAGLIMAGSSLRAESALGNELIASDVDVTTHPCRAALTVGPLMNHFAVNRNNLPRSLPTAVSQQTLARPSIS